MRFYLILVLGVSSVWALPQASAEQQKQLTKSQFISMFRQDLLAPCEDKNFMRCIRSDQVTCTGYVRGIIQSCDHHVPALITESNINQVGDNYANCVMDGLMKKFNLTDQQLMACESGQ